MTQIRTNANRISRLLVDVRMMLVAIGTAHGSTCKRRAVGCVLVRDGKVVATGYNGAPVGFAHCLDMGCITNEAGACIASVHAELNACLQCVDTADTAYCTDEPCINCLKALINKGVRNIYYWRPYEDIDREVFLVKSRQRSIPTRDKHPGFFGYTTKVQKMFQEYWTLIESSFNE